MEQEACLKSFRVTQNLLKPLNVKARTPTVILVYYVEEMPCWPIQSPSKGIKTKAKG